MKTKTYRISLAGLAAEVFFNVRSNGTVKVVWRYRFGPEQRYVAKVYPIGNARVLYRHYAAKAA